MTRTTHKASDVSRAARALARREARREREALARGAALAEGFIILGAVDVVSVRRAMRRK
jgi:hypothetical protein